MKKNRSETISIIYLTLKRKWFDMIAKGIKKEEYRLEKPYWQKRLIKYIHGHSQVIKNFDIIRFKNGYGKDAPTMDVECNGISLQNSADCNKNWGAEDGYRYFVIKLGKIKQIRY